MNLLLSVHRAIFKMYNEQANFSGDSVVKKPPAKAENTEDMSSIPGSGRSSGEGNDNPIQCPCLEESHGQKSLMGDSPWGRKGVGHDLGT